MGIMKVLGFHLERTSAVGNIPPVIHWVSGWVHASLAMGINSVWWFSAHIYSRGKEPVYRAKHHWNIVKANGNTIRNLKKIENFKKLGTKLQKEKKTAC